MSNPDSPVIAGRKPIAVELQEGETYHWCSCGRSDNQPFCDGSHQGTSFTPQAFTAEETGKAFLCVCKHTKNPPYCDGTHAKLPSETLDEGSAAGESHSKPIEPYVEYIHELARNGLKNVGHDGEMGAMGVPLAELPLWNDIQILPAQLAQQPLLDDVPVKTELIIGPNAAKPLKLDIPLFVSDMSFGALSEEAKVSLARGAELAAKTGTGGLLPGNKNAKSGELIFAHPDFLFVSMSVISERLHVTQIGGSL
jgi:CDGSH-type Zn-finger protein